MLHDLTWGHPVAFVLFSASRDLGNGTSYRHASFFSIKSFAGRVTQLLDEFLTRMQSGERSVCHSLWLQRMNRAYGLRYWITPLLEVLAKVL